jgi:hypothetical protein
MLRLLVFCFLLVPQEPPPPQQPDITVHVTKKGRLSRYLAIKAETKGEVVHWRALDPGLEFIDGDFAPRDPKMTGIITDVPGKYRVLAITSIPDKDGKCRPASCEFVVEFEGALPKPPEPPPTPVDPLVKQLQAAYLLDPATSDAKDAQKKALVGLYEAMALHVHSKDKDGGFLVKTAGDLKLDLENTARALLAPGVLVECRKVIAAEVAAVLPSNLTATLDDATRARAVTAFSKIARAMKEVK